MSFTLGKRFSVLTTLGVAALCAVTSGSILVPTWTTGANFPSAMVRGAGVWFPTNGRFYVMGGRISDAAGSDLFSVVEYNPGADTWANKVAVFPDNQNCNMVGAVLTEAGTPYIFCVGGSAALATTTTTALRRYDPVADVMTVVASDPWSGPPANTLAGGGAVVGNKLYVFGGFTVGVGMSSQIWSYDPDGTPGSRWALKSAVLPVPVGYVPCATIGGLVYIAGGATFSAGALFDSTGSYVYDPVADTLTAITATPRMTGETLGVNEGGELWVLGGGRTAPNPSNQVDAYAPGPDSWSLAPSFVFARRNMAADVDPATGNIYMAGGYVGGVANNSVEIFKACGSITTYCTAGTTSNGCLAAIAGSGNPSASAGSGFTITVTNIEGQKSGLIFYGIDNTAFNPAPWGLNSTSFLCVKSPTQRTPVQGSGGTINTCNGTFTLDWNAFIATTAGALGTPFVGGETVFAQGWFRDPPAPKTTNLSNALQFGVCP